MKGINGSNRRGRGNEQLVQKKYWSLTEELVNLLPIINVIVQEMLTSILFHTVLYNTAEQNTHIYIYIYIVNLLLL